MDIDLDRLAGDNELCSMLAWPFDFRVVTRQPSQTWYSIEGAVSPTVTGRDAAGGDYVLLPPFRRVLFVSSGGAAGIAATSAAELFSLVTELPYWQSLLKFSSGGQLREMRCAAPVLEEMALRSEPELNGLRDIVRSKLNLAIPSDPIGRLHRALAAPAPAVTGPGGKPAGPLCGHCTVDSLLQAKGDLLPWMPFA